tara:strand:+ start:1610 stop:2347 length:738 start_codon:yes stop_codon:yes gene_type:complete
MQKLVLVTGGSGGIGKEIVKRLAMENYKVITCARSIDKLKDLSFELKKKGNLIYPFQVDLRKEKEIINFFQKINEQFGHIDILVNSAAVGHKAPLCNGSTKLWKEMLDVNILALCICTREVMKGLLSSDSDGHIINISSLSGHRLLSEGGIYEATKFAVNAITESLRRELLATNSNIKVSQISPGLVKTDFHEKYFNNSKTAKLVYNEFSPLKGSDIAETVFYILSQNKNVQIHDILIRPKDQPL